MPRLRPYPSCVKYLLVVAMAFVGAASLLAQPVAAQPAMAATWQLSNGAQVHQGAPIHQGKVKQSQQGQVTAGITVHGDAVANGPAPIASGKFSVRYSIHENAGKFILRGVWRISKAGAVKAVHSTSDSLKGTLYAELTFNPATTPGEIQAKVTINPTRRHGGKTAKANGTFTGDQNFNGILTIR